MPAEVAIEMVFVIGLACLLAGILITFLMMRNGLFAGGKVGQLQQELDQAKEEMSDYKAQVFEQFSDTADKFKNLDDSYQALHKQLAASSLALCGDQATRLLPAAAPEGVLEAADAQPPSAEGEGSGETDADQAATVESTAEVVTEAADSTDTQAPEATEGVVDVVAESGAQGTDEAAEIVVAEAADEASSAAVDAAENADATPEDVSAEKQKPAA